MFSIGLDNIKNPINLGSAIRAAACFGAHSVVHSGRRLSAKCTDVGHSSRIPSFHTLELRSCIPNNHVPVAIELVDGAIELQDYVHPLRAFYIFGAEDNTLGERTLSWCRDVVKIPSAFCLNLAACVNVVLYDRIAKERRALPTAPPVGISSRSFGAEDPVPPGVGRRGKHMEHEYPFWVGTANWWSRPIPGEGAAVFIINKGHKLPFNTIATGNNSRGDSYQCEPTEWETMDGTWISEGRIKLWVTTIMEPRDIETLYIQLQRGDILFNEELIRLQYHFNQVQHLTRLLGDRFYFPYVEATHRATQLDDYIKARNLKAKKYERSS